MQRRILSIFLQGLFILLFTFPAYSQFKVVGYYPTWMNFPNGINNVDLAKVTHINIAFANPNSSGTLIPSDGVSNANVTTVVNACHNKNVKVFMSIGGAGAPATTYQSLLSSSTNINNFVSKIVSYATTYNLDGIDVDIEGDVLDGNYVTAAQYQSFVTALATSLHAQGKQMTSALAKWFGQYVTNTAAAQFDWINIMSYDAYGPWSGPGQHSPYSLAVSDFQYWNTTKGVPKNKLVIGVPFYGYGWGTYASSDEYSYCDIVSTYPGAENADQVGSGNNVIYYNGIATIKQKTTYAMQNAAGIMIWEIAEDCPTTNSKSLLLAIDQVVHANVNPTIAFNNITKNYGDAAFTVAATSNSGGAITYSITAGSQYATITSGGQVTIKGAGIVTIQASQAAATGYNAGTATATLTINKATLTAKADDKSKVYNTANPVLTITYSGFVYGETSTIVTTAPSISTTAVTNSNVGTYPISLSGGSAANYNLTLTSGTLTVTQATPTLSYSGATSGTQGTAIALSATTSSNGAISYSVANVSGAATVSGTNLNLTSAGTVTLTVSVAATQNYVSANIQITITINPLANPTISFNNITAKYGDAAFTVAATSNSNGSITYSITAGTQFATITSGGQVTIKGAGTVTIQASQAAATGYNSGTASATLTINKATLTAKADDKSKVYNSSNPALTITYSGFVYGETSAVVTTSPSISTTAVTNSNVGTYPITLSGGSAAYYNITISSGTLTVTQATPTLSYTGATSGTQGTAIALSASTSSNGAMSYSVAGGTGTATVSGTNLNLTTSGTVTLTVNVAATQNYKAGSVQQTITINAPILQNPVITFNDITKTFGDSDFNVNANSTSPGTITYSIVSGNSFATITSGGLVSIIGAGTVVIKADQAATSGYNSNSASATLTINKSDNSNLTYTGSTSGKEGDVIDLSVTSGSTGAVTYQVINGSGGGTGTGSGDASVSGNQLNLVSSGVVTLVVTIAADANHNQQVITQQISIARATGVTGSIMVNSQVKVFPNPVGEVATIEMDILEMSTGKLMLCDMNGKVLQVIAEGTINMNSKFVVPMNDLASGIYMLKLLTDKGTLVTKLSK